MNFDEIYFKSLNYTNYLEREERYIKLANELITFLQINNLIVKTDKILDYGAAVGFLTNAICKLNFKCDGYDISTWAKNVAFEKYNINYIEYQINKYDCLIALDVFEHMTDDAIIDCLNKFNPDKLIVRIPCSTNNGKSFHLNISNLDPTHINCKTKIDWVSFFENKGFTNKIQLNLYTIYDTEGVMCYYFSKNKI
jgi:2-polyprenyl-3-methyl-5-hydroxy-6-metoxy-1,4-benzoquinol methylase